MRLKHRDKNKINMYEEISVKLVNLFEIYTMRMCQALRFTYVNETRYEMCDEMTQNSIIFSFIKQNKTSYIYIES